MSRNGLQRGKAVGPSRATHELCCFETSHAGREAHCTLHSLQQLYVAEQAYVTLAGGSRARWEGTSRTFGSWLTVAQSRAMGAEKTVSSRGFIHTRLRARSFSYCGSTFDFSQPGSVRGWSVFLVFKPHIPASALTGTCWRLVPQEIWDLWGMRAGAGSPESHGTESPHLPLRTHPLFWPEIQMPQTS